MYRLLFKRLLDILISIIILPFLLLLILIVGLLIISEDKGPIFYKAPRLGKDGVEFNMYKFRSMKVNAPDVRNNDGSTFNSKNDPRVTKTGKFLRKTSIDEIPQVINVIKGEMSLIGPRPDLPEHFQLYEEDEVRKLEIKPGITGYNQAYFRNSIPWKERIKNDVFYIDNLSFTFDMRIIFKTFLSIVSKKNIYVEK